MATTEKSSVTKIEAKTTLLLHLLIEYNRNAMLNPKSTEFLTVMGREFRDRSQPDCKVNPTNRHSR